MFFLDDEDDSYDDSYYSDSYMYDTDDDFDHRPRSPVPFESMQWRKDWSDSGSSFQPKLMPWEFSKKFKTFFNQPQTRDVTLKVGRHQYACHRLILCAWSEVFSKMLDDPVWSASRTKRTNSSRRQDIFQELTETTECAEVFEDFLKYLYSEEIALNLQNVWPIILLADKYMVSALRNVCIDFLKKQIDHIPMEELWMVMKNAETCLVDEVREVALLGLRANFMHLSMKFLLSVDPDDVHMLLDSSDVVAEDEFQLWLKLRQFITELKKAGTTSAEVHNKLMKLVRLHQMSASQLNIVVSSDFMPEIYKVHGERAMEQALLYRAQFAEECTSKLPKGIPPPRLYLHNAHFLKYNLHSSHIGYKRMLKRPEPIKLLNTVTFFRDVPMVFYVSENKPYLCQKNINGASQSAWTFRPIFQSVPKSETKKTVTFVFVHEAEQYGWRYKIVINVEDEKNRKKGNSRIKVVSGVVEKASKGKNPEVRVTVPGHVYVVAENGLSAHLMVYMYVPHGKSLKPVQKKVSVRF